MKQQGIYKIRNLVNKKFYVGSSNNVYERFRAHKKLLRGNRHHCKHLQAAWNKYGEDCFVFKIVAHIVAVEDLFTAENGWLQQWVGTPECYNSGRSAEAPMRGMPKELTHNYGKPVPPEQRLKIAATLKATYAANPESHPRLGKKHTPEALAKIAANRTPPAGEAHYRYGKTVSPEVREKIGAAQRGVKKGPRVYTPEGLARARENMLRNAGRQPQSPLEKVIAKFPAEVQGKYDFSNAVYTGALKRITGCVCPVHGEFDNYAARFRKGWGCAACGAVQRAISKSAEMKREWADPEKREKMLSARK